MLKKPALAVFACVLVFCTGPAFAVGSWVTQYYNASGQTLNDIFAVSSTEIWVVGNGIYAGTIVDRDNNKILEGGKFKVTVFY